jgi:hypothetical protein
LTGFREFFLQHAGGLCVVALGVLNSNFTNREFSGKTEKQTFVESVSSDENQIFFQ